MYRFGHLSALTSAFALAIAASSATQAAMIPTLVGDPVPVAGGNYQWNYRASIGTDFRVKTGDFFTIYDFGAVLGHSQPAGWTFSALPVGLDPIGVLPDDNPALLNVTFTYTGVSQVNGPQNFEPFSLTINSNAGSDFVNYGSQATRNGGINDGQFGSDYGTLRGPASPIATPFPEPATLSLLAPAFALRRRRK
jgi:hypothetical protein